MTTRPLLIDLYCGAGMASDGYHAAGFDVIGVDINPQPNYPYMFIQADAIEFLARGSWKAWGPFLEAFHASPPCQAFTRAAHLRAAQGGESKYADLLTPTLRELHRIEIPFVVENVPGAPGMDGAARLCGSSFGLAVQRHRLFLTSGWHLPSTTCDHKSFPPDPITGKPRPWGVYHVPGDSIPQGGRTARDANHARELFDMTRHLPWDSIKEGFPPAYTEYVGGYFRAALTGVNPPAPSP